MGVNLNSPGSIQNGAHETIDKISLDDSKKLKFSDISTAVNLHLRKPPGDLEFINLGLQSKGWHCANINRGRLLFYSNGTKDF